VPRCIVPALAGALMLAGPGANAHDPSAYGGLFRSRDLGGTWLNADVGLFLNSALAVAVEPRDPNHLLLGTDLGLMRSRTGGRTWTPEAQGQIIGAVFALAFAPDGQSAVCAAPSGVFRFQDGQWVHADAPGDAVPARGLTIGPVSGRIYMMGTNGLFASDDRGQSYDRVTSALPQSAEMTALAVASQPGELLLAVIDGQIMASEDGGGQWQRRAQGLGDTPIDTVALDPASPQRVWAAGADLVYVSDDLGATWRAVGRPLPEPGTRVRGIAADPAAMTLVVTSHRGMYRSEDGGQSWTFKESNLPVHLESGPLVRDPNDTRTLYAVYSLMPFAEVWRTALEGGNLLARVDPVSLAGGVAFLLLLMIGGGLLARRLAGPRAARSMPGTSRP
jgi:photosystem II stability/assembly factor-like uncharacterized protein